MNKQQKQFLDNAFFSLTVRAAFPRSKTYRQDAEDPGKKEFRRTLREQLEELAQQYTVAVDEKTHIRNIELLANSLSEEFAHVLHDGRFRIGSAQKVLNLHLKYLWCRDRIPMPPHCPFDSAIIGDLPGCSHIKWTTLDNIEDYRRLVEAARAKAGDDSLARWELGVYNSAD